MSAFGWSYPPGCNGTPFDDMDEVCQVCGETETRCVCPTCRQCDERGNPECYHELATTRWIGTRFHVPPHRHLTATQLRHRHAAEKKAAEQQRWEDAQAELYGTEDPLPDDLYD